MSRLETLIEQSSGELCSVPLAVKSQCQKQCNACPIDDELMETLIADSQRLAEGHQTNNRGTNE
ncbi:hypothetical protein BBM02_03270 [Vibrio parahaemolyticus]|uniref:hypothetical protein n=1 Tax=Vibrio parahaemolyticus TaxID=670 RepID=UPI0003ED9125|nr:hypothetical protein [Vibrio parahaemolyticus]AHJ02710.1 hypothetical protein VPUCM_p0033 [Vibrio parahaemolyticus UCM-V493]EGR1582764.1 hypothetical protein [Vibrio parahaemolyticus]EHY8868217.1 hypothetical protein [Vibrio parahaemolyticus]ODX40090.1 hypothetical protein BBM02_03270 [Vibrio parahaemolyticus]OQK18927.1 hypothetical protein XM69_u0058 [Vibrio parahaemolyticus]